MITNEILSAYIDGELGPEEAERVRAAVAEDEVLAARLRNFSRVDALLVEFSSGIDGKPLPARVLALLDAPGTADGKPADGARATTVETLPHRPRWRTAGALALAASLVLAVAIGLQLDSRGDPDAGFDSLVRTGPVARSSALHHALQEVASDNAYVATSEPAVTVTPMLSFVSTLQEYCREFRVDGDRRAARGLACRRDNRWETLKVVGVGPANDGKDDYATATAAMDAKFETFVDGLVADAPLGADEEARQLREGWRSMHP